MQLDRDQRARLRIQDSVGLGDPRQSVAKIASRVMDALYLEILGERIGDLGVSGLDHAAHLSRVEQGRRRRGVHPVDQCVKIAGHHEIRAFRLEGLHLRRGALAQPGLEHAQPVALLPGREFDIGPPPALRPHILR